MENKDNTVYLRHMLDRIDKVRRYLDGYNYDKFLDDEVKIDAIVRNIEVIGEAANNLTREFRFRTPQVEWRKIIGTRNRIIHGYALVDMAIIWGIAKNDLPGLETEIEKLLKEESGQNVIGS